MGVKLKTYIIIGASAAGVGCMHTLRRLDPVGRIIMITQEAEWPYNKCLLADYLAGEKTAEDVLLVSQQQIAEKNIELLLGKRVIAIQAGRKIITLDDGSQLAYDALFIGTGASARMPALPGNHLSGVYTFQTVRDAQKLLAALSERAACNAVVIGAGLTGLECADALNRQGVEVAIVERGERVLGNQVDRAGAECIQQCAEKAGISLYFQDSVAEIIGDEHDGVRRVELTSGGQLDADMVIVAVGVTPNIQLARDAGIELYDQGIQVDEHMRTNLPDVYAGGDVAIITDLLTGKKMLNATWPDAMMQGGVAAHAMAGVPKKYAGAAVITSSSFFGVKFASCGPVAQGLSAGMHVIKKQNKQMSHLIILDTDDKVRGFSLVGDLHKLAGLRRAILTQTAIDKTWLCDD